MVLFRSECLHQLVVALSSLTGFAVSLVQEHKLQPVCGVLYRPVDHCDTVSVCVRACMCVCVCARARACLYVCVCVVTTCFFFSLTG